MKFSSPVYFFVHILKHADQYIAKFNESKFATISTAYFEH